MLIDTHCHLDFNEFKADFEDVIKRAKLAGVIAMQTICTNLDQWEEIHKLTKNDFPIFCSVGTHPLNIKDTRIYKANEIADICNNSKVIGIGETGLDYYYDTEHKALQHESFVEHILAAQETGLPLIIHTRNADSDTINILREYKKQKDFSAVLHCFTSSEKLAMESLELGFYISASGIVTFKNAHDLHSLFKKIPLEKLLVETDAPYLAPTPLRGKRNEPSFVKHTAEFLADLRGENFEHFCQETTQNFFKLFNKAKLN
ncbi:Mg-dependent DNase [endosymbiont of Acanthamoeba sp. UWC8]|uniref:TatD family hydrolase n=1 Tax=endosymbiont of Acanthamoeba sp. UWC8 TaxID=86106 RepID=UPI0004D0D4F7|nr:TatD family hydrolase [endosymbiont of Acanthamoeba sp. UWC8]AIF81756.1 Mg-dependent DNase [endosymbiont of Acanthamoeba sp. UWC8]